MTWDDHEVANDYANDRDERLDPHFIERRAAAYQAFYEHMPLRVPPPANGDFARLRMYQRYDWGGWRASTCSTTASTARIRRASRRDAAVPARSLCATVRRCSTTNAPCWAQRSSSGSRRDCAHRRRAGTS